MEKITLFLYYFLPADRQVLVSAKGACLSGRQGSASPASPSEAGRAG